MSSAIGVMVVSAGVLAAANEPLFTSSPGPEAEATIRVDASRAGEPISRRLFGKFTEHLHRNVYHGMWAQVLRNPGFEDWRYFFSNDQRMNQARRAAAQAGARLRSTRKSNSR